MTTITHTTKQQPQTVISQQTSIPFCNPKLQNASSSSELQALYQRFPTPNDFFHAYPPALQQRILIAGYTPALLAEKKDIPSMALLANLYGGSTPAEWLKQQLTSLNALLLADTIKESIADATYYVHGRNGQKKREKAEIGIHAVRGGSIVGDHEVIFAGSGEVIELSHKAISREVFAVGALKACTFMANVTEAGLYNMDDVLGI